MNTFLSRCRRLGACVAFVSVVGAGGTCQAATPAELKVLSVQTDPQGTQVFIELARPLSLRPSATALQFSDGQVVEADLVTTKDGGSAPQALAVCIDDGAAMEAGAFASAKAALAQLLETIDPEHPVAIYGCGSRAKSVAGFDADARARVAAVQAMRQDAASGGAPSLVESMTFALGELRTHQPVGAARMIAIFDARDPAGLGGMETLARRAQQAGVPVSVIALGPTTDTVRRQIESLANRTRGVAVFAPEGQAGLRTALRDANSARASAGRYYLLRFRYPGEAAIRDEGVQVRITRPNGQPLLQTLATAIAAPARAVEAQAQAPVIAPRPESPSMPVGTKPAQRVTPAVPPAAGELLAQQSQPPAAGPIQEKPTPVSDTSTSGTATGPTDDVPPAPPPGNQPNLLLWGALVLVLALLAVVVKMLRQHRSVVQQPIGGPDPLVAPPVPGRGPLPRTTKVGDFAFVAPAAQRPTAWLRTRHGAHPGRRHAIEKATYSIGSLASNDLVLADDEFVSGAHALIRFDSGSLYLSDRQSRNGTSLNSIRLQTAPMPLSIGDEITVGQTVLVVEAPGHPHHGAPSGEGIVR